MRIGVLSDTHMPGRAKKLPEQLLRDFAQVDHIVHAGDWNTLDVYEQLRLLAPVDGVAGNTDGSDIVKRFGYKKVLQLGAVRIGLTHGDRGAGLTEDNALNMFFGEQVDCVVFGHSHIPLLAEKRGVLLFNPGSPTDKRWQERHSYGMLEISEAGKVTARHIYL